jgi:transposase
MYKATDIVTNGITEGTEARKQRGMEIAALARIDKDNGAYLVPSVTSPRKTKYRVSLDGDKFSCTCPDFETRGCRCKHVYAVEYTLKREQSVTVESDGSATITETVTVTKTRKTYPQNWPAYNEAQQNEKRDFQRLLHDLCKDLPTPPQVGRGQRRIPMPDAIFCAVFKVFCTLSARRFTSDMCDAQAKGYIAKVPHFNSVLNVLENAETYPILLSLIERSSLPLKSIEVDFAIDSTGFAYSRFLRWYDAKYNKFGSEQQWIKAHICTGVKTNIITAIEIRERDTNDCLPVPELIDNTAKNFTMKEVSADKGYSGRGTHDAIDKVGAVPFVAFKANTTGGVGGMFEKMFHYFQFQREDFLAHYHKRSNVESTVMMVKTKFGDSVKSKTEIAAKNEVLAKVLCHNIACLVTAIYELGIEPVFCTTKVASAQRVS